MKPRNISNIPAGFTVKDITAGEWAVSVEQCDDYLLYHVYHPASHYIIAELTSATLARQIVREHNATEGGGA